MSTTATSAPAVSTATSATQASVPPLVACVSAASWTDAVQAAASYLATTTGPVLAIARLNGNAVTLAPTGSPISDDIQDALGRTAAKVFASADGWVCDAGAFAVRSIVSRDDVADEALVGVVTQAPSPGHLSSVAAALSSASAREVATDRLKEAETAGHVIDIADRLIGAADESDVYSRLAMIVKATLRADAVAVGRRQQSQFEIVHNDPESFELTEDEKTVVAAACDEAHVLGEAVCWPPSKSLDRPARRAIERAANLRDAASAWVIPLEDERGRVETILFAWAPNAGDSLDRIAAYWNPTVGSTVSAVRDARAGWWDRLKKLISDGVSGKGTQIAVIAMVATAAVLAIPLPYKPKCECRLEPSERRFVAAPFAATLKTVHVEPGDVVEADTLLAELDERELNWELAAIEAEMRQAEKRRNAALAQSNLAEAQIAGFDGQRLTARRELLESRRGRLGLKAPIAGIIVDGDLARAEGMPLELGESLYEVAPLDTFVCEVHVPEFDVHEVAVGQTVRIRLDARPGQVLSGVVQRLRPRAETWQDSVGFVAEVEVANVDGSLRPGMTGDARVTTATHSLARNLVHRAYGQWRRGW